MKKYILYSSILLLPVIVLFSCRKENNTQPADILLVNKSSEAVALSCDALIYPDSVLYPKEVNGNYIVYPVNAASGRFGAYPRGLDINNNTGAINVTHSESGLRYQVWYVADGSNDTCYKFITIAGINFMDSIYHLSRNQILAMPIYNATRQLGFSTFSTEFDDGHDDDDGDGFEDEPLEDEEVIPQGVALNKITGIMDLKASILNGALGPVPVAPGTFKDFILNYRINDSSAGALNSITFRLYFYNNQSQIPDSLKQALRIKRKMILFNNQPATAPGFTNYLPSSYPVPGTQKQELIKCRPPYIIIVQK